MSKNFIVGGRNFVFEGVSDSDPYLNSITEGFEDEFVKLCQRLVRPTDTVFDIGANIGVATSILSQAASSGTVHAFEPAPGVFRALEQNIERNGFGNVRPHALAVGERTGEIGFHEMSAWGHILEVGAAIQVPVASLDEIVSDAGLTSLDFIKMDIEGFEWAALKGGLSTIQRFHPIIYMEFNAFCQVVWSRTNPLSFAEWLFATFPKIYIPCRDGELEAVKLDALQFVHDVMVRRNCITNIILALNDERIVSAMTAPISVFKHQA